MYLTYIHVFSKTAKRYLKYTIEKCITIGIIYKATKSTTRGQRSAPYRRHYLVLSYVTYVLQRHQ